MFYRLVQSKFKSIASICTACLIQGHSAAIACSLFTGHPTASALNAGAAEDMLVTRGNNAQLLCLQVWPHSQLGWRQHRRGCNARNSLLQILATTQEQQLSQRKHRQLAAGRPLAQRRGKLQLAVLHASRPAASRLWAAPVLLPLA